MDIGNCNIFMHDDAPCHWSKIVSAFLKSQEVNVLQWPENSPDLNPIKNLWKILEDKVAEEQPSSAKQLVEVIKKKLVTDISARRRRLKGIHSRSDTNRTRAEGLFIYYPRLLHCLPESDAGSGVIEPASSFVIQNRQTSCSM